MRDTQCSSVCASDRDVAVKLKCADICAAVGSRRGGGSFRFAYGAVELVADGNPEQAQSVCAISTLASAGLDFDSTFATFWHVPRAACGYASYAIGAGG